MNGRKKTNRIISIIDPLFIIICRQLIKLTKLPRSDKRNKTTRIMAIGILTIENEFLELNHHLNIFNFFGKLIISQLISCPEPAEGFEFLVGGKM